MLASTHLGRSLLLGIVLLLAACEHADGGVCQGNGDCDDGLECNLSLDETRGVCRAPEDIDAGHDAGGRSDAEVPLGPDASPDASADSGAAGSGALDAGPDGGGGAGTGSDSDAGLDADGG